VIQREISRALVLNLSGEKHGVQNTDRRTLPLTQTSFLSRGTRWFLLQKKEKANLISQTGLY